MNSKSAFGALTAVAGAFVIVGSATGNLGVMLAALFDPGILVPKGSGGSSGTITIPNSSNIPVTNPNQPPMEPAAPGQPAGSAIFTEPQVFGSGINPSITGLVTPQQIAAVQARSQYVASHPGATVV